MSYVQFGVAHTVFLLAELNSFLSGTFSQWLLEFSQVLCRSFYHSDRVITVLRFNKLALLNKALHFGNQKQLVSLQAIYQNLPLRHSKSLVFQRDYLLEPYFC